MKRKEKAVIAGCLILCLGLSFLFVYRLEQNKFQEKQNKTEYVTSSEVSKLQYILNTLLLKTQTLEMLVVENGGEVPNFDLVAKKLCDDPSIRSLQLAPDGVVTYVYPAKGNENAYVDLFHTPERATEARAARDSGKMTLSGPFELYQGGFGVVGRRPVYLTAADDSRQFWGFAIIVLDLPDAFAPARLDMFVKEGFEYKLYRMNPDTQAVQIIDQSSGRDLRSPKEISFEVPNGSWTFSVMPKEGWISGKDVLFEFGAILAVTVLVTFLCAFVIQLKRQKEELYEASVTDSLTGLSNYAGLMKMLEEDCRQGDPFVLFFMDLDGFKKINDTYGHSAGNQVLIETAQRLKQSFSDREGVFRNGGDEFCAVSLVEAEAGDLFCRKKTEELAEKFKAFFQVDGQKIRCGISVGFAVYPKDGGNPEKLMREADEGMYRMKRERSFQ